MLTRIVLLSLRHRGIVVALSLVLLGWGAYVASQASLDVFPEFVQPQVTIQAEAPGLSPEQVETLVTRPVENAVNGASDLESVRSESIQGLSVVTTVFKENTDVYIARQSIAEKVATLARDLPDGVRAPTSTSRARLSPSGSAHSRASSPTASTPPRCRRSYRPRWTF